MGLVIKPRALPAVFLTSELGQAASRRAVRSGELVTVRRGALAAPPTGDKPWEKKEAWALAEIAAVARKLRNGAVISHRSAALLHGLWLLDVGDRPEVTQVHKPNARGASSLRRHCGRLPDEDVAVVSAVAVTSIERTIVDCARTMHPRDALVVADSGMRALIRPDKRVRRRDRERVAELRGHLLQMVGEGPGHPRRRARAVILAADPYSDSPKESVLRWIAVSRGLPMPETQFEVSTRGGTFYVDLTWRWQRRGRSGEIETLIVFVEYDGDVKYLPDGGLVRTLEESSAVMVAEKQREDLLREQPGASVVRFSRRELRDPEAVFGRLLEAMPAGVARTLEPVPELLIAGVR